MSRWNLSYGCTTVLLPFYIGCPIVVLSFSYDAYMMRICFSYVGGVWRSVEADHGGDDLSGGLLAVEEDVHVAAVGTFKLAVEAEATTVEEAAGAVDGLAEGVGMEFEGAHDHLRLPGLQLGGVPDEGHLLGTGGIEVAAPEVGGQGAIDLGQAVAHVVVVVVDVVGVLVGENAMGDSALRGIEGVHDELGVVHRAGAPGEPLHGGSVVDAVAEGVLLVGVPARPFGVLDSFFVIDPRGSHLGGLGGAIADLDAEELQHAGMVPAAVEAAGQEELTVDGDHEGILLAVVEEGLVEGVAVGDGRHVEGEDLCRVGQHHIEFALGVGIVAVVDASTDKVTAGGQDVPGIDGGGGGGGDLEDVALVAQVQHHVGVADGEEAVAVGLDSTVSPQVVGAAASHPHIRGGSLGLGPLEEGAVGGAHQIVARGFVDVVEDVADSVADGVVLDVVERGEYNVAVVEPQPLVADGDHLQDVERQGTLQGGNHRVVHVGDLDGVGDGLDAAVGVHLVEGGDRGGVLCVASPGGQRQGCGAGDVGFLEGEGCHAALAAMVLVGVAVVLLAGGEQHRRAHRQDGDEAELQ